MRGSRIFHLACNSIERLRYSNSWLAINADRVREIVEPLNHKIQQVEESAKRLNPEPAKKVTEVKLREPPTWPSYLVRGFGSVSSAILILGVVPFLMFFMLVRKDKWYQTMAQLLGTEE